MNFNKNKYLMVPELCDLLDGVVNSVKC